VLVWVRLLPLIFIVRLQLNQRTGRAIFVFAPGSRHSTTPQNMTRMLPTKMQKVISFWCKLVAPADCMVSPTVWCRTCPSAMAAIGRESPNEPYRVGRKSCEVHSNGPECQRMAQRLRVGAPGSARARHVVRGRTPKQWAVRRQAIFPFWDNDGRQKHTAPRKGHANLVGKRL